jgi:hypothetical protein
VGASGVWLVRPGGRTLTVEALANWGWGLTPAPDTARWCVPAGSVAQPGGAVPAQTCREAASAPPTGAHAARAALYLGYLDQVVDLWRIAAGYGIERDGASGALRRTVEVPVFLTVAGGKGAYAGLVRVTPSVRFGGPVGDRATVWAVSIALLGQRSLFSEEYDRL